MSRITDRAHHIEGDFLGHNYGNTHINIKRDIPKEQIDEFKKVMDYTKGRANNAICLELSLGGVPKEIIKQVADTLWENNYLRLKHDSGKAGKQIEDTKIFIDDEAREASIKRKNGYYGSSAQKPVKKVTVQDGFLGRKIAELFGEMPTDNGMPRLGVKGWYNNNGLRYNYDSSYGKSIGNLSFARETAIPVILGFTKYSEEKRQKIIGNSVTKDMLLTHNFQNFVPSGLKQAGITEKDYVRIETTRYFDDLYAITENEEEMPSLGVASTSRGRNFSTISGVGFEYHKIKTAKHLAVFETAYISMEALGIGLYHKPLDSFTEDNKPDRGYIRLLQHINQAYTQYGKLMKKGFSPSVARDTVIEQLCYWMNDYKNTDNDWVVFKRKDWKEPKQDKKEKPVKKRSGGKRKVATLTELKELMEEE